MNNMIIGEINDLIKKCLVMYGGMIVIGLIVMDWWFEVLNLDIFYQYDMKINLMGEEFNYWEEVKKLDFKVLKVDLIVFMIDFQLWWFVDWGYYGGLMICMLWYVVGFYWIVDGCGGVLIGNQ